MFMKRNKIIPAKFVQSNFHDQIKVVHTIKNVKQNMIESMKCHSRRKEMK